MAPGQGADERGGDGEGKNGRTTTTKNDDRSLIEHNDDDDLERFISRRNVFVLSEICQFNVVDFLLG